MKKLLILLFSLLTINVSAQIVEFSDEMLSQYDNKKQEEILTQPIDLDFFYPQINVSLRRIYVPDYCSGSDGCSFTYRDERGNELDSLIPNYIGYHIYIPENIDAYAFAFSSNYDTVALDIMPKGIYEVVGMVVTDEECCELKKLIMDSSTITKENDVTYFVDEGYSAHRGKWKISDGRISYRDLLLDQLKEWTAMDSIHNINRDIHNGNYSTNDRINRATKRAMLVLKGDDGYLYYLHINDKVPSRWNRKYRVKWRSLNKAFIVEQYEHIKDYLLNNKWMMIKEGGVNITTKEGLDYHFQDTVGVDIKTLAVKDGKYIAVMTIGPDSIPYHESIEFDRGLYYNMYQHSDTIEYLLIYHGHRENFHEIISKKDIERMKMVDMNLQNRINKKEEENKAAKLAEQERLQQKLAEERREIERQRQAEKQSLISQFGEKFGLLVFENKVTLGMTKEMCLKAWGRPRNKIITKIDNGTQEIWYYGTVQYLVFENGIVVECAAKS